MMQNI